MIVKLSDVSDRESGGYTTNSPSITRGPGINDWFVIGCTAGTLATFARAGVDYLIFASRLSDIKFPEIAGGAVLGKRKGEKPRTTLEQVIAYVADGIFGGRYTGAFKYTFGIHKGNNRWAWGELNSAERETIPVSLR